MSRAPSPCGSMPGMLPPSTADGDAGDRQHGHAVIQECHVASPRRTSYTQPPVLAEPFLNTTLLVPPTLPISANCFSRLFSAEALWLTFSIMPSTHRAFCSGRSPFDLLELAGPAIRRLTGEFSPRGVDNPSSNLAECDVDGLDVVVDLGVYPCVMVCWVTSGLELTDSSESPMVYCGRSCPVDSPSLSFVLGRSCASSVDAGVTGAPR